MQSKNYLFIFLIIASFVMRLSPSSANLSMWLLAAAAVLGPMEIILSIFLSWLYLSLNTDIFQGISELGMLGRYAILAAAIIFYLLNYKKLKINKNIRKTLYFSILASGLLLLHSILFSIAPAISISKSILWISAILILLISWILLPAIDKIRTFDLIFYILLFVEILSIFLTPFKEGRAVNGVGFQGFLNQPQVFGIVTAILCAIIFIKILKHEKYTPIFYLLLPVSFTLLTESKSRTALFAFVISAGIVSSLNLYKLIREKSGYKEFLFSLLIMLSTAMITVSISNTEFVKSLVFGKLSAQSSVTANTKSSSGGLSNTDGASNLKLNDKGIVEKLVFKDSSDNNLWDTYTTSRGGLVLEALKDIKENIFFGIGFGAGNVDEKQIKYVPYTSIAISYPVEKGVIIFGLLQEVGLVGSLLFLLILLFAFRRFFLKINFDLVLIFVMILLNMGEFILMSTGGPGMLLIILFTYLFSIEKLSNLKYQPK